VGCVLHDEAEAHQRPVEVLMTEKKKSLWLSDTQVDLLLQMIKDRNWREWTQDWETIRFNLQWIKNQGGLKKSGSSSIDKKPDVDQGDTR